MTGSAAWVALYLALVAAPLLVLLTGTDAPGRGFVWDLAIALGFAGAVMMGIQFVLTARFRRAAAPFGIDLIYYFHRYAAVVAFAAVVAHPLLIVADEPAYLEYFDPTRAPWAMTAGLASVLATTAVVVTSLGRKRLGISYDGWRRIHLVLAVAAIVLALVHVDGVAYYTATRPLDVAWPALITAWAGVLLYVRVLRPLLEMRRPWRVVEVRPERGEAWTVAVEPEGGDGMAFQPGQFAWLTLRARPFAMRDHPFSIASSPVRPRRLEFTIKALGDFTRTISTVRPGETAYVDGPYGAFTPDRIDAPGFVFLAGGIGIAPVMSMVRTRAERRDPRPALLIYAYRRWERLTFREEIDALASRSDLRVVYVLEEPPPQWTGAKGRMTRELLDRELPASRAELAYFVCGPEPMIHSVERALRDLGVPLGRIRSELFDLV